MVEFLFDTSNIQVDYTLFIGILLGLTVQMLWVKGNEIRFVQSTHPSSQINIRVTSPMGQGSNQMYGNIFLVWLVKFVRKKICTKEEPDSVFISNPK